MIVSTGARERWREDLLRGRLRGGLVADALDADLDAPAWRAARLTIDLVPARRRWCSIVRPVRRGRRPAVADALIRSDWPQPRPSDGGDHTTATDSRTSDPS